MELNHTSNDYSNYEAYTSLDEPAGKTKKSHTGLKIAVILVVILVCALATAFFIATRFPHSVRNMLINVDVFGLTDVGANEQARQRMIMRLPITFEEKQVLINRTVFLGASTEMVELALGSPVCKAESTATAENPVTTQWVYYMEVDQKPTILGFEQDMLSSAYKGSVLDVCRN